MIPDFLKRERQPTPDKTADKLCALIKQYRNHFGDGVITEPSTWSDEKWIKVLEECLKSNKTYWELMGTEYDPDDDY